MPRRGSGTPRHRGERAMQPPLTTRQRLAAAVLVLLVLMAVGAAWRVRRAGGAAAAGTPANGSPTAPMRHPNGDPDRPAAAPAGKWRVARSEAGAAGEESPT